MTNFHVTVIDEHDCCSIADEFTLEAVDKADAEVRLSTIYGDTTYIQVTDYLPVEEL